MQTRALMQAEFVIQRAATSSKTPGDEHFRRWINAVPTTKAHKLKLTIRIVDESEAQRFNREYRGRDHATNVLSFPAELPEGLPEEVRQSQLGDILICAPVVVSEALEQQRPENDHWAHLTIHGILHLLGYDHEQPAAAAIMESLETKILGNLGISDPYLNIA
ncbi:MAG: rRNA maturation RNase YbeY [Xanthomonadales bacterium]|nr:rRNA maturation RNase YbeY [Xanthomonadales bacterium]